MKGREKDEEDVSSYWIAIINRDETRGSTRSHSVRTRFEGAMDSRKPKWVTKTKE